MAVLHIRPLGRDSLDAQETSASPSRLQAPTLRLVTGRPRWPAVVGTSLIVFVMVAMLGAAVFHTQLAERQLDIDELERDVQVERDRFDQLRLERAVLRSPERIATEAAALGMVTGETSDFVAVDPMELAMQLAAAGVSTDEGDRAIGTPDPLDQFSDVKSVTAGEQ
jgi:hypothetical protein